MSYFVAFFLQTSHFVNFLQSQNVCLVVLVYLKTFEK